MKLLLSLIFPARDDSFLRPDRLRCVQPTVKMSFNVWFKWMNKEAKEIEINAEDLINRRTNEDLRINSIQSSRA